MSKVIVIGLDGMPPEIAFNLWIDKLPNLKRITKEGTYGKLESVIPYVTAPAWTSFITGKNPGKTGIFDFLLPQKNLSEIRPINSKDIKAETIYEMLKKANKKSALINLPVSYPPKTKNITITSFLTQSEDFIFPKKLKEEIRELKDYKIIPGPEYLASNNQEILAKECRIVEEKRFGVAKNLFKNKEWDFFFLLFSSTDTIQHKAHCAIVNGNISENSEVFQLFQDIDRYLGWFIDNLPSDTNLIVMSDHGFKKYNGFFSINQYFLQKGLLKTGSKKDSVFLTRGQKEKDALFKEKGKILKLPMLTTLAYTNQTVFKLAKFCYGIIKKFKKIKIDTGIDVDENNSKAVFIKGAFQSIYLNDKNRFENGLLTGEEYAYLKTKLVSDLKKLKDPTGISVFKKVLAKEDIFSGPFLKYAPDICIKHNKYLLKHKPLGKLFINTEMQGHSQEGIIAAIGPNIQKSQEIKNARITDIAPTILSILDMPIESEMDGKVLKSMINKT